MYLTLGSGKGTASVVLEGPFSRSLRANMANFMHVPLTPTLCRVDALPIDPVSCPEAARLQRQRRNLNRHKNGVF